MVVRHTDPDDLDGRMTVSRCREVSGKCSSEIHARLTRIEIDLALIKKHLGVNGQYQVKEYPNRRRTDDPEEVHPHFRQDDIVIENKPGNVSFPPPPRWLVLVGVGVMLLAGAGLILIIQTKTDLDRILKFQKIGGIEVEQKIPKEQAGVE